ncbi:MAG: hypothetical protein JWP97_3546 [Labilithrix sp.]|nr:hypothetical protein [Labilithrix sp.]
MSPRRAAPISAVTSSYEADLHAHLSDEARRGAKIIVPFLLPCVGFTYLILGEIAHAPSVRNSLLLALLLVFARWATMAWLAPRKNELMPPPTLLREAANVGSGWSISMGFAIIDLASYRILSSTQFLELALVATAMCGLAVLSMSARVWAYVGYVVINLGVLGWCAVHHADAQLRYMPILFGAFAAVLGCVAVRMNAGTREKVRLTFELRESALRDALTGLRNRAFASAYADQRCPQVVAHFDTTGRRTNAPASSLVFLLVDLDHFKNVNDTHGHAGGDEVLTAFASVAQTTVRTEDVVARWGGEEFLVVMEVVDRDAARVVADRLRRAVESRTIELPSGQRTHVTCSIGACFFPLHPGRPGALSWQETVALADAALYEAKRGGRNRAVWVEAATGVKPEPRPGDQQVPRAA